MTAAAPPAGNLQTRSSLAVELRALGVEPGAVVLTHTSLSALGWVCGGPVAVVQALLDVLGPRGTLVVPTHTTDNSDPALWSNPPVPAAWWPVIRDELPGFHPRITPTSLGAVPEVVRTWPGAHRSEHPTVSFAAVGPAAEQITSKHKLENQLGENSPLARVEALEGQVLLLGAGHASNTSFHLAEYRIPGAARRVRLGAATLDAGRRRWVEWDDIDADAGDFAGLGAAYELTGEVRIGTVGDGAARLMSQPRAVAFARTWLAQHRPTAAG